MDITIAYYHPFFHADVVRRDFEQIRATGATSIVYAIHEQEETRYIHDFERGFSQAHEAGLKVYLSLGRFGNLFAGPSLMPSWYTFRNPQSRVQDRHGCVHNISCFNNEPFRTWLFGEIEYYLTEYSVDGILLDEPRGPDVTCFCPACRALCPDITDLLHFRRRSMLEFLGELYARVKRVRPEAKTHISLLPQDLYLADDLAQLLHLDVIGCHMFWQLLCEDMGVTREWGQRIVSAARQHHKRSQLWFQNFCLSEQEEHWLDASFSELLDIEPDSIGCYYFWRNNAHPELVWERTRDLLGRVPRRQSYPDTLSHLPVFKMPSHESSRSQTGTWRSDY